MRISYWSSDVCSSDLFPQHNPRGRTRGRAALTFPIPYSLFPAPTVRDGAKCRFHRIRATDMQYPEWIWHNGTIKPWAEATTHVMSHALHYGSSVFERSEEHTSELQSLMRISYAVFCLKKKNNKQQKSIPTQH